MVRALFAIGWFFRFRAIPLLRLILSSWLPLRFLPLFYFANTGVAEVRFTREFRRGFHQFLADQFCLAPGGGFLRRTEGVERRIGIRLCRMDVHNALLFVWSILGSSVRNHGAGLAPLLDDYGSESTFSTRPSRLQRRAEIVIRRELAVFPEGSTCCKARARENSAQIITAESAQDRFIS
jgi:hypothetical protein